MSAPREALSERRSICRFCAALCGIIVTVSADRVIRVRGDRNHPISRGYMCPKGRALGQWHHHPSRLNEPLIRKPDGELRRVGWSELLDDLAAKLQAVMASGNPSAVGAYNGTAGLLDSTAGVWRTLFAKMGSVSLYSTLSVDAAANLLVQELVTGNPLLFAQPDPQARMTLLIGMNPMISHGQNFGLTAPKSQLRRWAAQGELWVIDPRRTETAQAATRHLAPYPGSEYLLLAYLVRELLRSGADWPFLHAHTSGIESVASAIAHIDLAMASEGTGLREREILDLLAAIRRAGRVALMTGTGVSMAKTANVTLLLVWVLHAVTGSLDRPGGAWFNPGFLRNLNVTGWPEVSYSGSGAPSRPEIPARLGEYSCAVLVDEIESGNLRALLVIGGNPIIALPETSRLRAALAKLEVLAVIDVVATGVTKMATHVLPSVGQLERADIPMLDFLSPHQFAQYTPQVVPPAHERKPIWWMIAELAQRLGVSVLPDGVSSAAATDDDLLRPLVAQSGVGFDHIKAAPGGLRREQRPWGWAAQFSPGGRWNLAPPAILTQLAGLQASAPRRLLLIPGRQRHKLNSQMSDGTAATRGPDEPRITMSPHDAGSRGITDGAQVIIASATGEVTARAFCDANMRAGVATLPHGFENCNVGQLTSCRDLDPLSGMVTQSGIEVDVRPVTRGDPHETPAAE